MDSERLLDTESTHNIKKVEEAGFRFCPPWGGAINSAACMSVATQQRGADKSGVRGRFFSSSRPACRHGKGAALSMGAGSCRHGEMQRIHRRRCAPRHISIDIRRDVKQRSRDGNAAPGQLDREVQAMPYPRPYFLGLRIFRVDSL